MISSFDYYKKIESPNMYLCNPDKRPICALNAENRHLVLRFNDLSELTFSVTKISGDEDSYTLIETKRLIYVEKIGWFQIVTANETISGDVCKKEVTAQSHQYTLKNRGIVTESRVYMFYNPHDPFDEQYDSSNVAAMPSVIGQLYKQMGMRISLSASEVEPTEDLGDWTITYIDPALRFEARSRSAMYEPADNSENVCRSFEFKDNISGYDFIVNTVEPAFNVIFEFDFLYHSIRIKTIDKITQPTDIYLSFDNIMNRLSIKENAEDIVTVMSCSGGDLDIRTVNPMGTNYIVDFEYYKQSISDDGKIEYPWMSEELIGVLGEWEEEFDAQQDKYSNKVVELQALYVEKSKLDDRVKTANLKLTDLQVARDQYINSPDETGAYIINCETVNEGEFSITVIAASPSVGFNGDTLLVTGHVHEPGMIKSADGTYTFAFPAEDSGTYAHCNELLENYSEGDAAVPLYFIETGKTHTYCKLKLNSETDIAKDEDGNFVDFSRRPEDTWTKKTGYITMNGVKFKLIKSSDKKDYYIFNSSDPNMQLGLSFESERLFNTGGNRYNVAVGEDGLISLTRYYFSGYDRFTTYRSTAAWCTAWESYINKTLSRKVNDNRWNIETTEGQMKSISDICNVQSFVKRKSEALYEELCNYWIEGEYANDNFTAYDSTTMAERIELAKELMAACKVDLSKNSQPKFEMAVDAINFTKIYEFRQFTNELALGRTITIEKTDGVFYQPALIALEYDLDVADSFTMTFSNASKPEETAMTFADLIKKSSSTSRIVSANWSNLTDYSRNKEEITNLIAAPLDRSLRAMQLNLAAQEFVVDDTGILGRKYDGKLDDANGTFSKEQIRIINNTIMFTDDNWATSALALGKIGGRYGLVADVLVGNLILGEKISIGSESGRVTIDNSGITIKNNSGTPVFKADKDGNVTLHGTVNANAGNFGVLTIQKDGSIQSSSKHFTVTKEGNLTAKGGTIGGYAIDGTSLKSGGVGMSSATTSGAYAFWAGSSKAAEAPFRVTNEGELYSVSGEVGGFSIGRTAIYNRRNSLDKATTDGVYIGTDGISFGYDEDNKAPKIYASADGTFRALAAIIYGNATLSDCVVGGNLSSNSAAISNLSAANLMAGTISFADTSFELTAGEVGKTRVTAVVTIAYGGRITVECEDSSGKPYELERDRSFRINWKSTDGIFGNTSGSSTLTIRTGEDKATADIKVSFHTHFEGVFAASGSNTYVFRDGEVNEGFVFNGNVIPKEHGVYSLGDTDHYWTRVYQILGDVGSDRKIKRDIATLSDQMAMDLICRLTPSTYKFKDFNTPRMRAGFIAQEVEAVLLSMGLTTEDWALVSKTKPNEPDSADNLYSLEYNGFIAPIVKVLQNLIRRVNAIENIKN